MTEVVLSKPREAVAKVSPSDTIKTTGILHFTIGVRDHIAAAKFYSDVLGCKYIRSNEERYSFMQCGESYFVLAKSPPRQSRTSPARIPTITPSWSSPRNSTARSPS